MTRADDTTTTPPPEGPSNADALAGRTAWSVVWAFLATAAGKLVWLGGMAVLARLLAPADFGLLAFGLVFVAYLESIGDLGTSAALIYWPARDREGLARTAQATFVVNLATGTLFFVLTQLAAPAVADFFRNPDGEAILRALAFAFPIKALGNTHDALLQKELRFRARMVPELGLALVKTAVAVGLAFAGFGVWSLVGGQLLGLAAWTAGAWVVVPWRPRLAGPGERLRGVLAYGRGIVAVDVMAAVVHHADLVVVGRMLGTVALGFYQVAYKVPEMTVTVALWVAGKVLFPALSRLHAAGGEMANGLLAALRYTSLLTLPAAVGLFFVARPLVLTLYGEQWKEAVPLLQALAVYMGLRSLGSPAGDLLKAVGRSQLLAGLAVIKAAVMVPVLILAGRHSALAVASALAGVTAFTALLSLAVAARQVKVGPARLASAFAPAVGASAVLALVLVAARAAAGAWLAAPGGGLDLALDLETVPLRIAALVTQVVLGVATYLAALRWLDPESLRAARRALRGGRPAPLATAEAGG